MIDRKYKLFGMALDPSDDSASLELKRAWMNRGKARLQGLSACRDPYEALLSGLKPLLKKLPVVAGGKFPLASWLTSKPEAADAALLSVANIGAFYDSGGLRDTLRQLQSFVEQNILPARPIMLGVDHSATLGVLAALSARLGAPNLSVIAFDQHFDGLPMSVRLAGLPQKVNALGGNSLSAVNLPEKYPDQLCCGNFWSQALDEGLILPQNLSLIGVADYPTRKAPTAYRQAYQKFEKSGCRFFPLQRFNAEYAVSLAEFIRAGIRTPYLYLSCDLDVGAYNFTWAARYMDLPGISAQNLLEAAAAIKQTLQDQGAILAGLDILEMNIHFLGLETGDGQPDATLPTIGAFLQTLLK
jgi:arginase family enzyme